MAMRLGPQPKLTLGYVQTATGHAKQSADERRAKLQAFDEDALQSQRLKARECKACYYLFSPRMAGQAMTERECLGPGCNARILWHNTAVPLLCEKCADKHRLCRRCGSTIDMRERRKQLQA